MPNLTIDFEQAMKEYDTADESEAAVLRTGLHHAQRPFNDKGDPGDLPDMPHDLSECSPADLGYWLTVFTAWHSYANGRLISFTKLRNAAAEKRSFAWSYLRRNRDGTVADKDDDVRTDTRYVQVNREYQYFDNMVDDLKCITDNLDRNVRAVSRAISVMEQRLGIEGYAATASSKNKRRDVFSAFVKRER
jgi:hypothetical protein